MPFTPEQLEEIKKRHGVTTPTAQPAVESDVLQPTTPPVSTPQIPTNNIQEPLNVPDVKTDMATPPETAERAELLGLDTSKSMRGDRMFGKEPSQEEMKEPGFFKRFLLGSQEGGLWEKPTKQVRETIERKKSGEQGVFESALQATGSQFGGMSDMVGETIMSTPVIGSAIEKGIGFMMKGGQAVGEALDLTEYLPENEKKLLQEGKVNIDQMLGEANKYLDENPRVKANITAPLRIGEVALDFVGGGLVKKGVKEGVDTAIDLRRKVAVSKPTTKSVSPDKILETERKVNKASNQLLQIGNKADEVMREGEFSNATKQFARAVGESKDKLDTFQKGVDFTDKKIKELGSERDIELKPFLKKEVDTTDYLSDLKKEIDRLESSPFTEKDVTKYKEVYDSAVRELTGLSDKELAEIGTESALELAGKKTVGDMSNLNKQFNKAVNQIHTSGGVKDLQPEQLARLQALELLRKGTRRQITNNTNELVGDLNMQRAGLIDAKTRLKIQRGRVNKAIDEINWGDWKLATWGERGEMIKEFIPMVKDIGKGNLQQLETKSKLLESIMDLNVRRIRADYVPQGTNKTLKKSGNISGLEGGTSGIIPESQLKQGSNLEKKTSLESQSSKPSISDDSEYNKEIFDYVKKKSDELGVKGDNPNVEFIKLKNDGHVKDIDDYLKYKENDLDMKEQQIMKGEIESPDVLNQELVTKTDDIAKTLNKNAIPLAKTLGIKKANPTQADALDFIKKSDYESLAKLSKKRTTKTAKKAYSDLQLDTLDEFIESGDVSTDEMWEMIVNKLNKSNKTDNPITSKDLPKVKKSDKMDGMNNLETEAKKYNSSDEFVKAQGVEAYFGKRFNSGGYNNKEFNIKTEKGSGKMIVTDDSRDGSIILHNIKALKKGKGVGQEMMNLLKDFADKSNKRIHGFVARTDVGGMSEKDLVSWYKKNGFSIKESESISFKDGDPVVKITYHIDRTPKTEIKTKSQLKEIWEKYNKSK